MKVLHVITALGIGGAERQLDLLLQNNRHDAEVVALYNFGSVGRRIAARGVHVYDLEMRSNRQVMSVFRLTRIMREGAYDIVHLHLYRACLYGRVAARLAGIPSVATEHSIGEALIEGRRKTLPVRLLYLATEHFSEATIAVSSKVRELLVEWGVRKEKIRVIPNGLDPELFAFDSEARKVLRKEFGMREDDFVLGSIGRLHAPKRYDRLLKAAAPLLEGGGVWFLLAGDGAEKPRLVQLARELGIAGRVIFAGERDDVPRLLSAMDLFVSSSEEETFGLAILEAATSGLRVVAAECPALDGLSLNGVLRVPADVPSLRRVLLEEATAGPTPHRARKLPERYDIRTVAAAIDELYESLLSVRDYPKAL